MPRWQTVVRNESAVYLKEHVNMTASKSVVATEWWASSAPDAMRLVVRETLRSRVPVLPPWMRFDFEVVRAAHDDCALVLYVDDERKRVTKSVVARFAIPSPLTTGALVDSVTIATRYAVGLLASKVPEIQSPRPSMRHPRFRRGRR